jgi:hypothetical protein
MSHAHMGNMGNQLFLQINESILKIYYFMRQSVKVFSLPCNSKSTDKSKKKLA